jgi:hypothetical protein
MVFFSLLPSWVSAQSKKLEAVKIGYSGVGIAHDLLKIMGNKLIFEKHGLNAQSIYIGSGSLMNQAVVAEASSLPPPIFLRRFSRRWPGSISKLSVLPSIGSMARSWRGREFAHRRSSREKK